MRQMGLAALVVSSLILGDAVAPPAAAGSGSGKDVAMLDQLSTEGLQVVFVARSAAGRLGSSEVDTEHLLLGILEAGKSVVHPALMQLGISPTDLVTEVEAAVVRQEPIPESVDLPMAAGTVRILERGQTEAAASGSSRVNPEHLLLSLLAERRGLGVTILERRGIGVQRLRQAMRASERQPE